MNRGYSTVQACKCRELFCQCEITFSRPPATYLTKALTIKPLEQRFSNFPTLHEVKEGPHQLILQLGDLLRSYFLKLELISFRSTTFTSQTYTYTYTIFTISFEIVSISLLVGLSCVIHSQAL